MNFQIRQDSKVITAFYKLRDKNEWKRLILPILFSKYFNSFNLGVFNFFVLLEPSIGCAPVNVLSLS